jgi:membrane fusion protein
MKISNAKEIIQKITENKKETVDALNDQLTSVESSLHETVRMLANTQAGLKKMRTNLSSYDDYLKKGLITKDQYNYQHNLYFQQQSSTNRLPAKKCNWRRS